MEHLQSWVDMEGETSFPSSFERLLDSQEGGIPWCWHTLATSAQTPCDMEKLKLDLCPLLPLYFSIDLTPLTPETCQNLTSPSPKLVASMSGNLDFPVSALRRHSSKEQRFLFLDCGSSDGYLPHSHSRFLKGRVSLWKAVQQHAKCKLSALTLNFSYSEHRTKTSLGFIVAFWFWWSIEKGSLKVVYC